MFFSATRAGVRRDDTGITISVFGTDEVVGIAVATCNQISGKEGPVLKIVLNAITLE